MNILIVGSGKGSWTIRGLQLGAALGARVSSAPSRADWEWADVAILVKHAGAKWAAAARQAHVPIAWDALDCWAQPAQNGLTARSARAWLDNQRRLVDPDLAIGATEAMAEALGGVYVPHHHRHGLTLAPVRADLQTVGYDGNPAYLGRWHDVVQSACRTRGWAFVINPPDWSAVDLVVALRAGRFDGWICREWKSGVKLVNALAAGRPVITQASAAAREIPADRTIVDSETDLVSALDAWRDVDRRQAVRDRATSAAPAFSIEAIAQRYQSLLQGLRSMAVR